VTAVGDALNTTLILWLNLLGTFVFGLSGGLAAVRARFDIFGVLVLSAVVGLAGGIVRDVLIGVPPATFRDSHYLVAVAAAGVVCFFAGPAVARLQRSVLVFDAMGLAVFCVTGATTALSHGLGPVQATVLGAITGIGGGMLRDILLDEIPVVLRHELYAIPALLGAAVVAIAHVAGGTDAAFLLIGAVLCLSLRLVGLRYGLEAPAPSGERRGSAPPD
jgi:uncharacterized membrane protein YeiH